MRALFEGSGHDAYTNSGKGAPLADPSPCKLGLQVNSPGQISRLELFAGLESSEEQEGRRLERN